jgi:hypothetical protein
MQAATATSLILAALVAPSAAESAGRPALSASRGAVESGQLVRLWGQGFPSRVRVRVSFAGRRLRTARTRRSGRFSTVIRVPGRDPGAYFAKARFGKRIARTRLRVLAREGSQPTPPVTPAPPAPQPVTLVAAGDIACRPGMPEEPDKCRHGRVADRVLALGPDAVATLGDAQYLAGRPEEYAGSFDPTWGRFRALIRPAVGNHEYEYDSANHATAAGHFGYFGGAAGDPTRGYYSYALGAWQVFVLNTGDIAWTRSDPALPDDCWPVSCAPGSAQEAWLRAALAEKPPGGCVVAYWHHPRYSSGMPFDNPETRAVYDALYDHGAELILTGHSHHYERFAPMDADGVADPVNGVRQFVVGTGGNRLFAAPSSLRAGSELYDNTHFGVIELSLAQGGYGWRFVDESGAVLDSGTGSCHGSP